MSKTKDFETAIMSVLDKEKQDELMICLRNLLQEVADSQKQSIVVIEHYKQKVVELDSTVKKQNTQIESALTMAEGFCKLNEELTAKLNDK
jgi:energy-coupling factor transporter ATP-binding protein EcfA2